MLATPQQHQLASVSYKFADCVSWGMLSGLSLDLSASTALLVIAEFVNTLTRVRADTVRSFTQKPS